MFATSSRAMNLPNSIWRCCCQRINPGASPAKVLSAVGRRRLHSRAPLSYDIESGLGRFLSPQALRLIAVDYQDGLLSRLNDLVKDTPYERMTVANTVVNSAGDRSKALEFNFASEALNNAFFLRRLAPNPRSSKPTYSHLKSKIDEEFGSFQMLKDAFTASVAGMSGSGYVWLVCDHALRLGIIGTYGSGTLLVRERFQEGDVKILVQSEREAQDLERGNVPFGTVTHRQPTGPYAHRPIVQEGSKPYKDQTTTVQIKDAPESRHDTHPLREVYPLLCISVHEHAWMTDHGLWGRERYAQRFWEAVEWDYIDGVYENLMTSKEYAPWHKTDLLKDMLGGRRTF